MHDRVTTHTYKNISEDTLIRSFFYFLHHTRSLKHCWEETRNDLLFSFCWKGIRTSASDLVCLRLGPRMKIDGKFHLSLTLSDPTVVDIFGQYSILWITSKRQIRQVKCNASHFLMHSLWKMWPQSGRSLNDSMALIELKRTAHSTLPSPDKETKTTLTVSAFTFSLETRGIDWPANNYMVLPLQSLL